MNRFKFAALAIAVATLTWGCAQTPAQPDKATSSAASAATAAKPAAAATAPSQGGKAAQIQRFLAQEQSGIEGLAAALVTESSNPIARAASQYLQTRVPPEQRNERAQAANAELKKYYDETYPTVRAKALELAPGTLGPMLDASFSEEELRRLNDWIASPVAKKYQDLNPQMQTALLKEVVAQTRGVIEPKVRQLDVAVGKALGAPVAAQGGAAKGAGKGKTGK